MPTTQRKVITALSPKQNGAWGTPIPFGSEAKYILLNDFTINDVSYTDVQSALEALKSYFTQLSPVDGAWKVAQGLRVIASQGIVEGTSPIYTDDEQTPVRPTLGDDAFTQVGDSLLLNVPDGIYHTGKIDITSVYDKITANSDVFKVLWVHMETRASGSSESYRGCTINGGTENGKSTRKGYIALSNPLKFTEDQDVIIFISAESENNNTKPEDDNNFPGYYLTNKNSQTNEYYEYTSGSVIDFAQNYCDLHKMYGNTDEFGVLDPNPTTNVGNTFAMTDGSNTTPPTIVGGGVNTYWTAKNVYQLIKYEIAHVKAGQTLILQAHARGTAGDANSKYRSTLVAFYNSKVATLVPC